MSSDQRETAQQLLNALDAKGLLQDVNSVRDFVARNLDPLGNSQESVAVWVVYMNTYLDMVPPSRLLQTQSCADYVYSVISKFLESFNLHALYNKETAAQLNLLITRFIDINAPLGTDVLLSQTKRFTSLDKNTLNFLHVFTVSCLYQRGRTSDITLLHNDFTYIDTVSLTRNDIFVFYSQLARALFAEKSYQVSRELFQVAFMLPVVLYDDTLLKELISVYTIESILLGLRLKDKDPYLVKFSSLIPSNILHIFQCYQIYDLNQFIRLTYLEYVQRQEIHPNEYLFTKDNVEALISRLVAEKGHLGGQIPIQQILQPLGLTLRPLEPDTPKTLDMLSGVKSLAGANSRLSKARKDLNRALQLRDFQRGQRVSLY